MPNIKISDLPPITLPIDGANTFFEAQTVEAGQDVSRKASLDTLFAGFGLDATFVTISPNAALPNERVLTAGSGIALVDGGPNSTITISSSVTFPLLAPDGSAGAPSYSFASETDGGMYWDGSNIAWSSLGTPVYRIDDTGLIGNNVSPTFYIVTDASPSDTIPIYAFNTDADTGIGQNAADQVSIIGGGVEIARATEAAGANQFAIAQSGASTVPELTSLADPDTGFRWPADNTTVWIGGGTRAWNFSTAQFFSEFSNGPALANVTATLTVPTVLPDQSDANTGLGANGSDAMSLVAGGVEMLRVTETGVSATDQVFLPRDGAEATPALALGATDRGFWSGGVAQINASVGGSRVFFVNSSAFTGVGVSIGVDLAAGPRMLNETPSGTNPTVLANQGDTDTGLGHSAADAFTGVAGGVQAIDYAEASSHIIQTNEYDTGLTASVTQTQAGGLALLSSYNEVATVANSGDALTAFSVAEGERLIVVNNGANDAQLFPAVGDDIGAGVDTAITIATGEIGIFIGRDATNWDTLYNDAATPGGGGPGGVLPLGTVVDSALKWDGVSAWVEDTQFAFTGGSTGFQVRDATLADFIRIGHNGTNALVDVNAGTSEVIFGLTGGGPSLGWRFEQLVRVPDGSAGSPGLAFITLGTEGFFRNAFPGVSVTVTGVEQLRVTNADTEVYSDDFILAPNIGTDRVAISVSPPTDTNDLRFLLTSLIDIHWRGTGGERFVLEEYNLAMEEKSAAPGDVAGFGQYWVRDDVPNTAMFTNDAGVDKSLVNDAVQARRTTSYTLTTAFADVTLDTTDIETDSAVLDHDVGGSSDNIIVGQPGTYEVTYGADIDPSAAGSDTIRAFGRVRLNDAGVDIPGSLASDGSFEDGSITGDDMFGRVSASFIVTLAATDFLTLQMMKVEVGGIGTFTAEEVTVTVKRLL
jgi:hypothetical protein